MPVPRASPGCAPCRRSARPPPRMPTTGRDRCRHWLAAAAARCVPAQPQRGLATDAVAQRRRAPVNPLRPAKSLAELLWVLLALLLSVLLAEHLVAACRVARHANRHAPARPPASRHARPSPTRDVQKMQPGWRPAQAPVYPTFLL